MRISRKALINVAIFMIYFYMVVLLILYNNIEWRDALVKVVIRIAEESRVKTPGHASCYTGNLDFSESTYDFNTSFGSNHVNDLDQHRKCYLNETDVDIQMETEWDDIDVSYPRYVLSVSGWMEMVTVSSWQPKPLTVIIVPFSHQDPGWHFTYEEYYRMSSRKVLSLMVDHLTAHPNWTFIWSEVSFLQKWWEEEASEEQKSDFKMLVQRGQLELVTGGWVMSDEAVSHYWAMLDQMIEGNAWLTKNIGVIPNISWSIDPFGHSPTMTYLQERNNVAAMITQRIHYAVKRHFANSKGFEFMWKQTWESADSHGILCHVMPFLNYAITHSCGPDQQICCQFDFSRKKCYRGSQRIKSEEVTKDNIEKLSWLLWEQYQKKSELFRSNILLINYGDDFRYETKREWKELMENMEKIIHFINNEPKMKMKIKFGTLSDYFSMLRRDKSASDFPSLSGDFFPYTDRADQYWSGFYTTRPHLKAKVRRLQSLLRSTEILYTLILVRLKKTSSASNGLIKAVINGSKILTLARRQLAILQHHDAITGTSRVKVMMDYDEKMDKAFQNLQLLYRLLTSSAMLPQQTNITDGINIVMNNDWENMKMQTIFVNINTTRTIFIHNALEESRQDIVRIQTNTTNVKVMRKSDLKIIPHQLSPVVEGVTVRSDIFELTFEISMEPLSIDTFILSVSDFNEKNLANVKVIKASEMQKNEFGKYFPTENFTGELLTISNDHITLTFFTCNGRLQYLTKRADGHTVKFEVKVMKYGTGSWSNLQWEYSGAYIFMPNGSAQVLEEEMSGMFVIEGNLYTRVTTIQPSIIHSVTLYHTTGTMGSAVVMDNDVDLQYVNNAELIVRLETDISDDGSLCTDLNGFQMHKRKRRKKLKVQGNFFPMTTMSILENKMEKLTVLTSSSRGVASLESGWIEMVLDRQLNQDDWRGLNEGVTDNVPTHSQFILLYERRNSKRKTKISKGSAVLCYPSPLAGVLSNQLEYPMLVSTTTTSMDMGTAGKSQIQFLMKPLPCNLRLVNLRFIEVNNSGHVKALLILHRLHFDCHHSVVYQGCLEQATVTPQSMFMGASVQSIYRTSIFGTHSIETLAIDKPLHLPAMTMQSYIVVFDKVL